MRCTQYVMGLDMESFLADQMRREAVCFCIVIVGEAINSVPKVLQNRVPEIPWAGVVGMRNRIVHEYWDIDFETVFQVAIKDARQLAHQLDTLMRRPA